MLLIMNIQDDLNGTEIDIDTQVYEVTPSNMM